MCEYICDELAQTNIFGHYISLGKRDQKDKRTEKERENNTIAYNLCKKWVFDDNFDELNKLIRYCITQNINNIKSYQSNGEQIVPFIVNELVYVIFHDLTIDGLNNNGNDGNKLLFLFPKLSKMFKMIYNLSCYMYCYPFLGVGYESFYVSQYFDLRNTLYRNIFGNGNDDEECNKISLKASKLDNYNYFCYFEQDGTLLHKVCSHSHRQYCEILLKTGFDMNESNRRYGNRKTTPFELAKEQHNDKVLVLFRNFNINEERKTPP